MTAIETHGLTRRYGAKVAVDALDLSIGQGELFALLGVNGAGKTTTIKMLSCLTRPSAGDARVLGASILADPMAVKARIGVSPQETAVAPNLSVRENLAFIAAVFGAGRHDAARQASAMLERMGLGPVSRQPARTLSGGWQRRVSIAMALVSKPSVLFLDEPTLGLDVLARRELWQVIRELRDGMTIVLTTHYLEEVEALADRVAIMAEGRLRAAGTVADLIGLAGTTNFEDAFVVLATAKGAGA